MQISQGQMVLYGVGPQVFEDPLDWRSEAFESRTLLVPEWARSTTDKWEWAALVVEYSPDRLYARIQNPDMAQRAGWDVGATRRSIMNAHPLTRTGVMFQNWSWHQDQLKNGTYYYADQSKLIRAAHFYFREFPEDGQDEGRITEAIIDLDALSSTSRDGAVEFLFRAPRRYGTWKEVIHPMFWQSDVNGYYHSVTGLGIEMYAALEYLNRLLCRNADDAFAPKLFFKPTTASQREGLAIAQMGRYAMLPAGLESVQQHVQPFLQDGIAEAREIQALVQSNLSQFRSQSMTRQQGNPATATEVNYQASEQAKMGKTQLSRIYEQMDWLYAEKYHRASNPQLTATVRGGREAVEFVRRCKLRGVPKEALACVDAVTATRVVGQGSAFLRQQALEFLLGLLGTLPEAGRANLIRDVVASRAGQDKVDRYAMRGDAADPSTAAQQSDAMLQVAGMKVGVPPVPTPVQNPALYAGAFLQAAEAALQALSQGGDPHETVAFNDLAIPATQTHMQRMAQDQSRRPMLQQMGERLTKVKQATDQVRGQLQQQAEQRQQAQAQMQQVDPETQVGMAKVQAKHQVDLAKAGAKHQLDVAKTQAGLQLQEAKQRGELALKAQQQHVDNQLDDATTAHSMALESAKTRHSMMAEHAQTLHGMHIDQGKAEHEAMLAAKKAQAEAVAAKNGKPAAKK